MVGIVAPGKQPLGTDTGQKFVRFKLQFLVAQDPTLVYWWSVIPYIKCSREGEQQKITQSRILSSIAIGGTAPMQPGQVAGDN